MTSCTFVIDSFGTSIESLAIADYSKSQDARGRDFKIEIYELDFDDTPTDTYLIFSETVKIKKQKGNNGSYGYTKFNIGSKIKSNSKYRIYLYDIDNENYCYFTNSNKNYVDCKFDLFGKYVIQFERKSDNTENRYFKILEDDLNV